MENWIKVILIPTLILFNVSIYAVPNTWGHGYNFGQAQYFIENEQHQSLEISCGEEYGKDIYFNDRLKSIDLSASEDGLSFLFDDEIPVFISSARQSLNWNAFNQAISKAHKIEVFHDNHSIAVFKPLPYTVKTQMQDIVQECADEDFNEDVLEP